MKNQPKPATGEWTKETVREICRGAHGIEQEWQRCANAHNAALAAEREKVDALNKEAFTVLEENKRLAAQLAAERKLLAQQIEATAAARLRASEAEQQLAAEREKYSEWHKEALLRAETIQQLREQLAAAVEAMRKAKVECAATHFVVAERILDAALAKIGTQN